MNLPGKDTILICFATETTTIRRSRVHGGTDFFFFFFFFFFLICKMIIIFLCVFVLTAWCAFTYVLLLYVLYVVTECNRKIDIWNLDSRINSRMEPEVYNNMMKCIINALSPKRVSDPAYGKDWLIDWLRAFPKYESRWRTLRSRGWTLNALAHSSTSAEGAKSEGGSVWPPPGKFWKMKCNLVLSGAFWSDI